MADPPIVVGCGITAVVTGASGQIASYLIEYLLSKGCVVHGISRDRESIRAKHYSQIFDRTGVHLHFGSLEDHHFLNALFADIRPTQVYNLGASSVVNASWMAPVETFQANILGLANVLEAVRKVDLVETCHVVQAGTSEMFGETEQLPQTESTPFSPTTPYGTSKVAAHLLVKNYRQQYGLRGSNAIIFNHESPRKSRQSRTQSFAIGIAKIYLGMDTVLMVGNPLTRRDWGHARDLARGLWLMAQESGGDDFICATSNPHSIQDFLNCGFASVGIQLDWRGHGAQRYACDAKTDRTLVKVDPLLYDQTSHDQWGDNSKAKTDLRWEPEISFEILVTEMVQAAISTFKTTTMA